MAGTVWVILSLLNFTSELVLTLKARREAVRRLADGPWEPWGAQQGREGASGGLSSAPGGPEQERGHTQGAEKPCCVHWRRGQRRLQPASGWRRELGCLLLGGGVSACWSGVTVTFARPIDLLPLSQWRWSCRWSLCLPARVGWNQPKASGETEVRLAGSLKMHGDGASFVSFRQRG